MDEELIEKAFRKSSYTDFEKYKKNRLKSIILKKERTRKTGKFISDNKKSCLVLDGDGEPVAADEADRTGGQSTGEHEIPFGCVADHRFRPTCPHGERRRIDRVGGRLRTGHQPAPRPGAGESAPASASERSTGGAGGHRW